jgi:hypothetical protein
VRGRRAVPGRMARRRTTGCDWETPSDWPPRPIEGTCIYLRRSPLPFARGHSSTVAT